MESSNYDTYCKSMDSSSSYRIESKWYLLQCKPREEMRAKENLENQGYNIFLPRIVTHKKTRQAYIESKVPLFPGYLFIKLNDAEDNWAPIRSTRGVSKFVSFGKNAAIVPIIVINNIKQQIQYQERNLVYPFSKGDKVSISSGPFKTLQAVFDCRSGQQRAWVLLELMGQWQRIAIEDVALNKVA